MAPLTGAEVAKHGSRESCWVIVHGHAYDVTEFLPEHPGGAGIILKYAGRDATAEFEPIHPPDTLEKYLDRSKHLGAVDMSTVEREAAADDESPEERARQQRIREMPLLSQCYNLLDFEAVARRVMKKTAWGYYSSAADDEIVCPSSCLSPPNLLSKSHTLSALVCSSRRCVRTMRPSTASGSDRASSSTSQRSTSPRRCWARRRRSPST